MQSPPVPPDVSVIVPVYKAAETIEACLTSLLTQTLAPERFEVLAVVNGPEDGSRELILRLTEAYDRHTVKILTAPIASAGAARNLGLDEATGAHITFVDSDDRVSANYLAELLAAADGLRVPVAGLVDVLPDGAVDDDTPVMRAFDVERREGFAIDCSTALAAMSVCKLYPAGWLRTHRFDQDLKSGEDVVFNGILFSSFAHRFAQYAAEPYLNGARYYRSLTQRSVSRGSSTFEFGIEQRLGVIQRITSGPLQDPEDRPRLITAMVSGQASLMRAYLQQHPEDEARAMRAIADAGVDCVDQIVSTDQMWPTHAITTAATTWRPGQRLLLLSGSTSPINELAAQVNYLRSRGMTVRLGFFRGPLDGSLGKKSQHRFTVMHEGPPARSSSGGSRAESVRRRVRRVGDQVLRLGRRTAPRVLPRKIAVQIAARVDAVGKEFLAREHLVIALDAEGRALAAAGGYEVVGETSLHAWVLGLAARQPEEQAEAALIARSATWLADASPDDPYLPPPHVWALAAWRLVRGGHRRHARTVLAAAQCLFPAEAAEEGYDMLDLLAQLPTLAVLPDDAVAKSAAVAVGADHALEAGDIDKAAFLISIAAEVQLAQDFHTNVADPPLLRNPEELLSGLRGSRCWSLLTASSTPAPERPVAADAKPRVLLLPGTYPKFSGVIVDSLQGHADVRELRLGDLASEYRTIGVSLRTIRDRLAHASGLPLALPKAIRGAFDGYDAVFVDWADKGAVLASLLTPPGTRLVIRFHGVDSLSLWQLLVDWGRVTDVVFVSQHLRRAVERVLGDRIAHVRTHVLPNKVDVGAFTHPSTDDAHRTLGMVGWAQRVKDPLWTLEVLARLRANDPRWRLRLIGKDFERTSRKAEADYAEAFRARVLEEDLAGAVEYVGFTEQLPRHVAGIGFAISSSLRESFHIGALEMVAGQAVPVFRDWPVYRDLGGTSDLFPNDWVVDSPREAAERVLAFADRADWEQEATAAREITRERFRPQDLGPAYRGIVLGERFRG